MLKTMSLISLATALLAIVSPYGFEALVLFSGVASAFTLKPRPVVSSIAFMINLFNVVAHVPGLVFPESEFSSGLLAFGGPLHWGFLAVQFPMLLAGFLLMTSMNAPRIVERATYNEPDFTVKRSRDSLF